MLMAGTNLDDWAGHGHFGRFRVDENPESEWLLKLGELRGLLRAFAWVAVRANHGYTFTIDRLPIASDIQASLVCDFGEHLARPPSIELLDNWAGPIANALESWLFQSQVLIKPEFGFDSNLANMDHRRGFVDSMIDMIEDSLRPSRVWRVHVITKSFYECAWDDFAIECRHGFLLLHLGVSD